MVVLSLHQMAGRAFRGCLFDVVLVSVVVGLTGGELRDRVFGFVS